MPLFGNRFAASEALRACQCGAGFFVGFAGLGLLQWFRASGFSGLGFRGV